jgi:hypothetical protein
MGKQPLIKQDGVITEALSNAMFRVRLRKWSRGDFYHIWKNENALHSYFTW